MSEEFYTNNGILIKTEDTKVETNNSYEVEMRSYTWNKYTWEYEQVSKTNVDLFEYAMESHTDMLNEVAKKKMERSPEISKITFLYKSVHYSFYRDDLGHQHFYVNYGREA